MKRPKALNSAGDTIVEVLIVLAVLSMAFAISSATAHRGLNQSHNAEEHSEALGALSTQVELLRSAISQQTDVSTAAAGKPFCMTGNNAIKAFDEVGNVDRSHLSQLNNSSDPTQHSYPDQCYQKGRYNLSIIYVSPPAGVEVGYYQFSVRWDGLASLGPQHELFIYRTHQLTAGGGSGINLSSSPPQIAVQVKQVLSGAATPPTVPTCADPANGPSQDGVSITLTQINGTGGSQTLSTPNAIFAGVDNGSYRADLNPSTVPSRYQTCATTSGPITPPSGVTTPVDFKIVPKCHWVTRFNTTVIKGAHHDIVTHQTYIEIYHPEYNGVYPYQGGDYWFWGVHFYAVTAPGWGYAGYIGFLPLYFDVVDQWPYDDPDITIQTPYQVLISDADGGGCT
jgi:type II secretory pathway pseudopilin PulG